MNRRDSEDRGLASVFDRVSDAADFRRYPKND